MRVLVCGGRNFIDRGAVFTTLDLMHLDWRTFSLVIHGAARGADTLGAQWAMARNVPHTGKTFEADWRNIRAPGAVVKVGKYGPYNANAGFDRNQRMIDEAKPEWVVAFPGGRGTADMIARAEAAGISITRFKVAA